MNLRNHLVNWGVLPPPPALPTAEETARAAIRRYQEVLATCDKAKGGDVEPSILQLRAAGMELSRALEAVNAELSAGLEAKGEAPLPTWPKPGWKFGYGRWLVRQQKQRKVG